METTHFIEEVVGHHDSPGQLLTPDDKLRAFIAATELAQSLARSIAEDTDSPTRAALFASSLEHHSQMMELAQLHAAQLAQQTLLHELPPETLTSVREIADHPADYVQGLATLPADQQMARTGRLEFKNTAEALHGMLGISFYDARDRLQAARSLLPQTGFNGHPTAPHFPKLADQIIQGRARVKDVCTAARNLEKLRPSIDAQPDAKDLARRIEEKVADSLTQQRPAETKKLIDTIGQRLEALESTPSAAEIREKTGIFITRRTRHFTYLNACLLNSDAEIFLSHFAQSDNPRTIAGNRQSLADSATQPNAGAIDDEQDSSLPPKDSLVPSSAIEATEGVAEPAVSQPELLAPSSPDAPANGTQAQDFEATQSSSTPWFTADPALALDPVPLNASNYDFSDAAKEQFNSRSTGCDGLTAPQRHLQTLINIMRSANQSLGIKKNGKITGLPAGKLLVIIKLEVLLGLAKGSGYTAHGLEISATEIRRRLANDGVIPLVLGGDGEILDLGRERRQLSEKLKLAVQGRDGGCIFPGCTVPPELCEFNHINQWQHGGHTRVKMIHMACINHHHMIDNGELKVVIYRGLPHVILPKYLDPDQLPRRNNYWKPVELTLF